MESFTKFAGLAGAVTLVTGGATGIGSAIVENFLCQGCRVVFLDKNADAGKELVVRLSPRAKIIPEFVYADLKDLHSLKRTIESIQERTGTVKVLVNNAANDERHEMEEVTPSAAPDIACLAEKGSASLSPAVWQIALPSCSAMITCGTLRHFRF